MSIQYIVTAINDKGHRIGSIESFGPNASWRDNISQTLKDVSEGYPEAVRLVVDIALPPART